MSSQCRIFESRSFIVHETLNERLGFFLLWSGDGRSSVAGVVHVDMGRVAGYITSLIFMQFNFAWNTCSIISRL